MKDWADLELCTVTCRCNAMFRAKHRIDYAARKSEIDRPCPSCGKTDNVFSASYDPEFVTVAHP